MTDISEHATDSTETKSPDKTDQAATATIELDQTEYSVSSISSGQDGAHADPTGEAPSESALAESALAESALAESNGAKPRKVIFDRSLFRQLTIAWTGIVAALSLSPVTPSQIHQIGDKAEHFIAYALLSFLATRGWSGTRFLFPSFLIILGFGVLMEGLQWYVPGRSLEGLDMVANGLGAFAGLIMAAVWQLGRTKP